MKRILSRATTAIAASMTLLAAAIGLAQPSSATTTPPTMDRSHWMYFGTPGANAKAQAFVGGELAAALSQTPIQYYLTSGSTTYYPNETATDLRDETSWTLDSGYLPSPISTWPAGSATITIQHFSNFITGMPTAGAAYTRVTVTNPTAVTYTASLNITAPTSVEVPLGANPDSSDTTSMTYNISVAANSSQHWDFVTKTFGHPTSQQLIANGSYDTNYTAMASYWNNRLQAAALPDSLPDPQLVTMYKAEQIIVWESLVQNGTNTEIWGSGGNISGVVNYARTFNHDVPDIVSTYIRGGDFADAKAVLSSATYASFGQTPAAYGYIDAIPKFIQPFDLYEQDANDPGFFTSTIQSEIQSAAHSIQSLLVTSSTDAHVGLMQSSNTMDNGNDYLLTDDWSALYGLQAYANLTRAWAATNSSWNAETTWATNLAASIDSALNNYLTTYTLPRLGGFYNACLDSCAMTNQGYTGNTIGSTLMDSALPWDGYLAGNSNLGTWNDKLQASVLAAWTQRADVNPTVPPHSWGAWSIGANGYGSTYNAANGIQLLGLTDPTLRREAVDDLEFLLANQSSPMEWGESYKIGSYSTPLADLESWGSSGILKTLLETSVSVAGDGTLIIGRGIPQNWLDSGQSIVWRRVQVGGGQTRDVTIAPMSGNTVQVTLSSGVNQTAKVELPSFVNNIASATAGTVNQAAGEVDLAPGTTTTTVTLSSTAALPITVSTAQNAGYTFGQSTNQITRAQTFFASDAPTLTDVKVAVRQKGGTTGQTDITVGLYAVSGGVPTGTALATGTIPASSVGSNFTTLTAPLSYNGLVDGRTYAIVLGQQTPGAGAYEWATSGSDALYDFSHWTGTQWIKDIPNGDAALTVDVSGRTTTAVDLSATPTAHYSFGKVTDQVSREQDFLATGITSVNDVRAMIRRHCGTTGQSAVTATLYAVAPGGSYTGSPLATGQIPASEVGSSDTVVDIPLAYSGLVPGQQYAVLLGQVTDSDTACYEWATAGAGSGWYGYGQIQANRVWVREPSLGQGWLQVNGRL